MALGELVVVVVSVLVLVPGDADSVVVVVLLLLLVSVAGVVVAVVVVFVLELLLLDPPAGLADGFTTVVLFSVELDGDAGGLAVSVFCSHAARSAALASMQMYFFIDY